MNEPGISEAASENPPKQSRGRPKVIPNQIDELYRSIGAYAENNTRRGQLNVHYRIHAMRVLDSGNDPERFLWLMDKKKITLGTSSAWKPWILSELGRVEDDDELRYIASELCRLKPKARDAVAMIRRHRLGRSPEASAVDLTARVVATVNDYIRLHPETTWKQVLASLENAIDAVEEARSGAGE